MNLFSIFKNRKCNCEESTLPNSSIIIYCNKCEYKLNERIKKMHTETFTKIEYPDFRVVKHNSCTSSERVEILRKNSNGEWELYGLTNTVEKAFELIENYQISCEYINPYIYIPGFPNFRIKTNVMISKNKYYELFTKNSKEEWKSFGYTSTLKSAIKGIKLLAKQPIGKELQLEVGKLYKNRKGNIVKIIGKRSSLDHDYPYIGNDEYCYTENGNFYTYSYQEDERDLIEEVNPHSIVENVMNEFFASESKKALKLEVGKKYVDSNDRIILIRQSRFISDKIIHFYDHDFPYPFYGWNIDGIALHKDHADLIEEVE